MEALELQAGQSSLDGSVDPKLGIVALKLKCWAPTLLAAILAPAPAIGVGLVENQPRQFSRMPAGDEAGYEVSLTLEGHTQPDQADGEEYSLEGTTSEDPIETHPEYQALLDLYNGTEDASSGKAKWPKTISGGEQTFAGQPDGSAPEQRNPMHGVEGYLVPGLTWTRKSVSRTLPYSIIRSLGTIDNPPGNPPELSGNRNWLKIRARATFRGNVWQIEETWLLSGPDGWVPEMYRYR